MKDAKKDAKKDTKKKDAKHKKVLDVKDAKKDAKKDTNKKDANNEDKEVLDKMHKIKQMHKSEVSAPFRAPENCFVPGHAMFFKNVPADF